MTRSEMIAELDKREQARNEPNRRGMLVRCYESVFYRPPPKGASVAGEPSDNQLIAALLVREAAS